MIRLSPSGSLHFEASDEASHSSLQEAFDQDWRAGWFRLGADKGNLCQEPSLRFWQEIASNFLTALCHRPADVDVTSVEIPDSARLSEWVLKAPPMVGGEYLSQERLLGLWEALQRWSAEAIARQGGVQPFIAEWAPEWQLVGRVCFHLAENKKDPDRPFAFLATYATGVRTGGKLAYLPLKEALKQYSGTKDKPALVKLLTPIYQASLKCPWIHRLLETSEVYQALLWTPDQAYAFLRSIPEMEESGLLVRIPNWWKQRVRPQVAVTIGSDTSLESSLGLSSLLDFKVEIALGEERLTEEELAAVLASGGNFAYLRGQWVEVDREKLQEALAHWKKVKNEGGLSFVDGMRLLAGVPVSVEGKTHSEAHRPWIKIASGGALSEVLRQLRNPSLIASESLQGLSVSLRPYQHEGVKWLSLLSGLGVGACLADDMGLGKTLQVLSLLLLEQKRGQKSEKKTPSLLIVPASLLSNWKREAARFTPALTLVMLHPSEIKDLSKAPDFSQADLVLTTYAMAVRLEWLSDISWNLFILDEAQAIKNSAAKQTQAIKGLKSRAKIALTGTPIENRLSDLWSLFDFLNPGLLGSATRFKEYIQSLQGQFDSLRKLISPYILRRMKSDPKIISDLPAKIETAEYCCLTKQQAEYYQGIVNDLGKSLATIAPKERRGLVLKAILQLKQICNHPSHFLGTGGYSPSESGKFERLGEICEELASRQEKVLIFTQFKEILAPLEEYLSGIFGRRGLMLHGGTPIKGRQTLVESFQQEEGAPFFVLSLKAGGTGLTLTAASHVIHFDRWWNPAVENQATDRAFRIGQKKNVQVHKFITQGTVEEKIDAKMAFKSKLANDILSSTEEVPLTELSDSELLGILALDVDKASIK